MRDLGPADGRQKMSLLEWIFSEFTPIPEEGATVPCTWIPGEAQPSCGFDPNCPECKNRCPGCGCDNHQGFCADCGCLDSRTIEEKSDDERL